MAIVFLPFSIFAQTAYDTDAVDYYVSDNAANESLEEVNFIMCMMNAMAADKMVNRGPYKVSLYEDDCDAAADASATSGAAAKPKSAKSAEAKKSTTTTTTASTAKTVTVGYADVTRADDTSPQIMKAWIEIKGQMEDWAENMSSDMLAGMPGGGKEPDITVFLEMLTTAAPSATSQFGEFDLAMSFTLSNFTQMGPCPDESATAAQKVEVGCAMPAGSSVGGGRILASGDTISYVDFRQQEAPVSSVLKFTGDKIEGIATKETGYDTGAPDYNFFDMELKEAFVIDNSAAAVYCSKTISAGILDFDDFVETDGYFLPTSNAVTLPHAPSGTSAVENCYSLKESDANKNVHRYGVYDLNGSRAALTGVAAFPMTANVTDSDGANIELFGWADNWNIHVENPGDVKLWDENTVFTKEQYAGETGSALQIKIAEANQRVTKYEKSYLALSDLDKLTMITWINPNDDYFGAGYQSLGFTGSEAEYSGSYNKNNETWTFTKKIDWSSGWNETILDTAIAFTNTQAISALSSTNEETYTQDQADMNGLQVNTWRFKITDYLQGATLSASASENVQYWWLSGPSVYAGSELFFGGYPWGKDTGDSPGIDLENLQGLINGTANARPLKLKGYFGNIPNAGSGTTTVTVTLTQGDDVTRNGTEDQITGSVPVAWTSNGTSLTATVAAGTTLTGSYNDGGSAVGFSFNVATTRSKTLTKDSDGNFVFELLLGDGLKFVKDQVGSFASFFSDDQEVNFLVDFGVLPVYTVETQSEAVDKFALTLKVKSSPGVNAADAWTNERGIWAWSPDTGNGYEIGIDTLRNPISNTTANGIQVETRTELTPTEYPAKLKCVFGCTSAATINATANAAKALSDYGTVVSPYIPATVQYIKSGEQIYDYYPGVLATDVLTYTPDGLTIKDAGGTAMGFAASITVEDVRKGNYKDIPNENSGNELEWGIRVNSLLGGTDAEIATQLATLECARSDNTKPVSNTNAYRETHPTFSATATRYCDNAFYEGTGPTTWYEIEFGAAEWQRKKYAKNSATGLYVNFAKPKVLYYDVPNDAAAYGNDAGKSVRLDFGGFGDLWGIPGNVINVQTGEVIGEFVEEWNDSYRYVQRFAIEPHSTQSAGYPVLYEKSSSTTYKVKALEGEQWLKKKDSAKGTLSYTLSVADLPKFSTIRYVSPTIFSATGGEATVNPDSIGAIPAASTLINSGKPAVIHGDLAVTF